MNTRVLDPEVQDFLRENEALDTVRLALKPQLFDGLPQQTLVQQLEGRKRSKQKLPSWYHAAGIYFPPKVNLEQTSSEITAQYKASLTTGESGIDLSGGFGVDTFYLAQSHQSFTYCERDPVLFPMACHNFKVLGADNIRCVEGDGIQFLQEHGGIFDTIYVDPSRRSNSKGKVFRLEDCAPDLTRHMELLLSQGRKILVKTSPLLDLQLGLLLLKEVATINILAIQNEVKELLWECHPGHDGPVSIRTRNWQHDSLQEFDLQLQEEADCSPEYGSPDKFLYEPNAAILKAGAFGWVGISYQLRKIAPHSHLYTAGHLKEFPGRRFRIHESLSFSKKGMKALQLKKANISTRNFPLSVAALRKRLRIKDGGDDYLFFTTDYNGKKIVLHCSKA